MNHTGRRFRNRNVRFEMKTVECVRCHRMIRLDEYKAHLVTCAVPEQTVKIPEPVPTTGAAQQP